MGESAAECIRLADAALIQGRFWVAALRLREAFAGQESDGRIWSTAIAIAERIGDDHAAVLAAERLRLAMAGGAAETCRLAEALTTAGRADEAVVLLQPLADAGSLTPDQSFKLTRMLMFAGRIDEAQARARALLKLRPDSPTLWERIAMTKRFGPDDPDLAAMRKVFRRRSDGAPAGRSAIAAALAKAYVDIGDDAQANRFLEARAEANRAQFPFDARVHVAPVADTVAWCESGRRDPEGPPTEGGERPVLILGPARSGTTLLDQVFAGHSAVRGGGELRHLWLAAHELGDHSTASIDAFDASRAAANTDSDRWGEFGRRYLYLADERFGAGARFTDKLLSNVYRIRAIRRALPQARILYISRDPLDVAWSCWRTQFDADSAWSNSPETTALYVNCYRRMMEAWMRRYPDALTEISYESLVRDPEREIPRLLQACGLPDETSTRRPELAGRPVGTMSFAQVRAPINDASIGSAAAFPISTRKLRAALEATGARV